MILSCAHSQVSKRTKLRTPPNRYPTQRFAIGDEVVWSRAFLFDTGADATDHRWFMRGRVTSILAHLCHVEWRGDPIPWLVAISNLAKPLTPKASD